MQRSPFSQSWKRILLPSIFFCAALQGCGGNNQESLWKRQNAFNQSIRWGIFDRASAFVTLKNRAEWLSAHQAASRSLKITEMQMSQIDYTEGEPDAYITMCMSFYREPQMTLQNSCWRQHWHKEDRIWFFESEEPATIAQPTVTPSWP